MADTRRIRLRREARRGEIIQIKTLVSHLMESGQRKDAQGKPIPRKIINKFSCEFNGKPVFSCALEPAISANPYIQFDARIDEEGTFKFAWIDDDGSVVTAEEKIALKA